MKKKKEPKTELKIREDDDQVQGSSDLGTPAKSKKKKSKKRTASGLDSSEGTGANADDDQVQGSSDLGTPAKSKKNKSKKRTASGLDSSEGTGADADMNEPTMAEKLASLDLVDEDNKSKSMEKLDPAINAMPPSADSVHVLLKQALHADDQTLLLDCLYTRDEKVIAKSTSLLNPADVLKLLKSLTNMMQLRGAVLVCALPWLKSLLSQHASSIASQESSLLILNSLYQLIESRISTFGSALQLSTCLDILSANIADDEVDEVNEDMVPAIIYEDKDSDEEESVDVMETDDEDDDLGDVINSPRDSDGSEVMSD